MTARRGSEPGALSPDGALADVAEDATSGPSHSVDLVGVLEAGQALSSETNLDRLRARITDVLVTMTGATSVRLLLWNEDSQGWFLPAGDGPAEAAVAVDDVTACDVLPISAFRHVEASGEPLLVADATRDDRFLHDPYIAGLDCCSLLVVPIAGHGRPLAILVLENRLKGGVFTADRLATVMLIAGQLAVSIDNALGERFRSLVQRSSDLTLVCDRDGVLTYASAASSDLLGLDAAALTGRVAADVVQAEDRAEFERRLREPEAQESQSWECRVVHDDGTMRWVQVTFTDLRADPAVGGLVLLLRDLTERRRLEQELRHAQKLESVGQLAAGIAHEINTPIQFVGDNVTFLVNAFADLADVLRTYQQINEQIDRQGALLDAAALIEKASRLAADRDISYLLDEIPTALAQTKDGVSRVATIVRAMKAFGHQGGDAKAMADINEAICNTLIVATNEIKYVADVVTELGDLPPVWCNVGDINQAVLNLVVNAAHAIGEAVERGAPRGTITVRTRRDGAEVVIEVQDTGAGIPPEIADRVFDQFFTTKPVGSGTGQGLALSYALIHDRHGGTLGFTSQVGVGTTFTIRLPFQAPENP